VRTKEEREGKVERTVFDAVNDQTSVPNTFNLFAYRIKLGERKADYQESGWALIQSNKGETDRGSPERTWLTNKPRVSKDRERWWASGRQQTCSALTQVIQVDLHLLTTSSGFGGLGHC
jgi:hypothetical protein